MAPQGKLSLLTALLLSLVLLTPSLHATLIVDPAQPITRQVNVRLTVVADNAGANPATAFGNASQQASILAGIDAIWAQAGIDVNFTFATATWNNSFALTGNAGSGTRPTSDLNTIFNNAASFGGILDPNPLVLNLLMVQTVPGFTPLSANSSAGFAFVGGNGIAGYVGANLLTFQNGLDVIAGVMGHEIGHNLGLSHFDSVLDDNLMEASGQTAYRLTNAQINSARASSFAVTVPEPATILTFLLLGSLLFLRRRSLTRLA